jgi:hypothetical protein
MQSKICSQCKIEKSLDNFSKESRVKNGYQPACKSCNKSYYFEHQAHILSEKKKYQIKNRKQINKRIKLRRNSFLEIKIKSYLRNRVVAVLQGKQKSGHIFELLGCDFTFLKTHLEAQFTEGMTWKNYGINGWEIDHIKPCCHFDLSKSEEQKNCFHYSNLRPLWYNENRSKAVKDKYTKENHDKK